MVKYRKDFVTNSSSVCYVCEISGVSDGGSDCVGIEEYGFARCENGHIIDERYISNSDEMYEDEEYESQEHIPAKYCPICQMKEFKEDDLLKYALKALGTNKTGLKESIRTRFNSYTEFKEYIK